MKFTAGVIVCVSLYLAWLIGVGIYSWSRSKLHAQTLTSHFMAQRSLGPTVLSFTLMATVFSGYTVVGIPNEAHAEGFLSLKWPCIMPVIVAGNLMINTRLSEVAVIRKYISPCEFVRDRYPGCLLLSRAVTVIMFVPMLLYLVGQFDSLARAVEGFSDGQARTLPVCAVLGVVILIYEWFGGLSSVALTDVVQASMMLLGGVGLSIVLGVEYGPWRETFDSILAQPQAKEWNKNLSGHQQIGMLSFMLIQLAFPLYPHVLQRVYAADSSRSLKISWIALLLAPYIVQLPGIVLGMYGADPDFFTIHMSHNSTSGFFGHAMEELTTSSRVFSQVIGTVYLVSALAAIMSTAASAIMGASVVFVWDIMKSWLWIDASQSQLLLLAKGTSVMLVVSAVGLSLLKLKLEALFVMQGGLLAQALPTFMFGLYSNTTGPYELLAGIATGLLVLLVIAFGTDVEQETNVAAGLYGLAANVFVVFTAKIIFKKLRICEEDEDALTYSEIVKSESRVGAPTMSNPVTYVAFLGILLLPPWFFTDASAISLTGGLPTWVIVWFVVYSITNAFIISSIIMWQPYHSTDENNVLSDKVMVKNNSWEDRMAAELFSTSLSSAHNSSLSMVSSPLARTQQPQHTSMRVSARSKRISKADVDDGGLDMNVDDEHSHSHADSSRNSFDEEEI